MGVFSNKPGPAIDVVLDTVTGESVSSKRKKALAKQVAFSAAGFLVGGAVGGALAGGAGGAAGGSAIGYSIGATAGASVGGQIGIAVGESVGAILGAVAGGISGAAAGAIGGLASGVGQTVVGGLANRLVGGGISPTTAQASAIVFDLGSRVAQDFASSRNKKKSEVLAVAIDQSVLKKAPSRIVVDRDEDLEPSALGGTTQLSGTVLVSAFSDKEKFADKNLIGGVPFSHDDESFLVQEIDELAVSPDLALSLSAVNEIQPLAPVW